MKKHIIPLLTAFFFLLLLIFPDTALNGAKNGLTLWFFTVLPTLLPFMIVSNLMIQFQVTEILSSMVYPVFGKIFRISKNGCYPIIIGLLSGYPVGAKACGDLVCQNKITKSEGQFLLCFCNNASPMYVISFLAASCLKHSSYAYLILGILIISGILSAFTYRLSNIWKSRTSDSYSSPIIEADPTPLNLSPFLILDKTIFNAFEILVKIGGYIILFSILAEIISKFQGLPLFLRCFSIGFLEITTGTAAIASAKLTFLKKIILTNFLTAFGGLSSLAQTYSVLIHSGLSIRTYFIFKLISGCYAAIITFLLINII